MFFVLNAIFLCFLVLAVPDGNVKDWEADLKEFEGENGKDWSEFEEEMGKQLEEWEDKDPDWYEEYLKGEAKFKEVLAFSERIKKLTINLIKDNCDLINFDVIFIVDVFDMEITWGWLYNYARSVTEANNLIHLVVNKLNIHPEIRYTRSEYNVNSNNNGAFLDRTDRKSFDLEFFIDLLMKSRFMMYSDLFIFQLYLPISLENLNLIFSVPKVDGMLDATLLFEGMDIVNQELMLETEIMDLINNKKGKSGMTIIELLKDETTDKDLIKKQLKLRKIKKLIKEFKEAFEGLFVIFLLESDNPQIKFRLYNVLDSIVIGVISVSPNVWIGPMFEHVVGSRACYLVNIYDEVSKSELDENKKNEMDKERTKTVMVSAGAAITGAVGAKATAGIVSSHGQTITTNISQAAKEGVKNIQGLKDLFKS